MFFFFIFGEHTFRKAVPGYEKLVCQCYNCGNMSGRVLKSNPWFTLCWIVSLSAPSPPWLCRFHRRIILAANAISRSL